MTETIRNLFEHFLPQVENRHFEVEDVKFHQIYEQLWCDKDKAIKTFFYQGKEYVAFGGYSDFVKAHRVVNYNLYQGTPKPLSYGDFYHEVNKGTRERSWLDGFLATAGTRKLVFCERYIFSKSENSSSVQLKLF